VRRIVVTLVLVLTLVPSALAARILGVNGDRARMHTLTGQASDTGDAFLGWNQGFRWGGTLAHFLATRGNIPMLSLKTDKPYVGEVITPRGIAQGRGDAYLFAINRAIFEAGKTVYIRPMPEMNGYWNPYCTYNASGTRRDAAHSQAAVKNAFRRIYLILHGGAQATLNAKLSALGLPTIHRSLPVNAYPTLRVIWNPQGYGSPDLLGNRAKSYWPGGAYVDVVGDDLYFIRGKAEWPAAGALYAAYPQKPFAFPEWGLWGVDEPSFIRQMRSFVRNHRRVAMIAFFLGKKGSIFDLATKPRSRAAYRTYIAPLG